MRPRLSVTKYLMMCVVVLIWCAPLISARTKYNFNSGWRVFVGDPPGAREAEFDDASWKTVTTPYAWNEDDAFRKDIKDLSTGVAWYRKHFTLPENSARRKVFLEFEGIRHGGEFYLNGKFIGRHENGVMAFGFDITEFVRPNPQANVIPCASIIHGIIASKRPTQLTSGATEIFTPTTAASIKTSSCTSPIGFIKYEFARPERISEVTLKLANWRNRSYPLRITVDDKQVFKGETPRSLGYVTLAFPPVTGSNLKIELGAADETDDKGTIGIVEIEIYDASQANSQSTINPKLPTIFVVGDSTANNNANGGRGWGDPFINLFDATKVNVLNRARAGRSSRTFITQGLWDNVLSEMKRGDTVLIQFGHNDGGVINDASRARGSLPGTGEETQEIDNLLTKEHEVVHTFGWYLRKMIADTKAKGATPIVMSLTVRNIWKDGRVERGSGKFGQWAKEVAMSQKVQFVDVTKLIADKYEELGEAKVRELFAGDHTHTNPAGAELNALLILTGLKFDRYLNHRLLR